MSEFSNIALFANTDHHIDFRDPLLEPSSQLMSSDISVVPF